MSNVVAARALAAVLALAGLLFWQQVQAPFAAIAKPEPDPSMLFVGDIMLDRNVAKHAMASSTAVLFAGVLDLFKTADANVANLEGSITTNPSIAQRDSSILRFTFDPELARAALAPLNLSAASLANNHAYDFYSAGYDTTQNHLKTWGIKPFGHPYNEKDLHAVLDIRGKRFCLVGYHGLYDAGTTEVVQEITNIRAGCSKVIVIPHWGDEYKAVANAQQVVAAHEFIDAGADLVVGAHPHVVQNVEVYKDKAIFYSLGNFMFDQNFSWATQHGLALKITFGPASTHLELIPVRVIDEEVSVAKGPDAARVLEAAGRLAEFTLP
jgi:poly-gamma-glutamate capsule biosynthesis protein CapA/YwtB (metallophosphatase superfamily)